MCLGCTTPISHFSEVHFLHIQSKYTKIHLLGCFPSSYHEQVSNSNLFYLSCPEKFQTQINVTEHLSLCVCLPFTGCQRK